MGSEDKKKAVTVYVRPELKEEFDSISEYLAVNKSKYLENCIARFVRDNQNVLDGGGSEQQSGS